jgi:hypothetical protein
MGRWAIALHGGAGDISRNMTAERKKVTEQAVHECLQIGVSALENSASALDVVEKVVSMAALNGHDGSFLFSFFCFATEPHLLAHVTNFSVTLGHPQQKHPFGPGPLPKIEA